MARSVTKAQRRELKKVTRHVAEAEKEVADVKSQKQASLEEIQRLRGRLGACKCAEQRGPCRKLILSSPPHRCEDMSFGRFRLQITIDELREAQAYLASILRFEDYLKMDLAEYDSG